VRFLSGRVLARLVAGSSPAGQETARDAGAEEPGAGSGGALLADDDVLGLGEVVGLGGALEAGGVMVPGGVLGGGV
jgi:hypothetical protein